MENLSIYKESFEKKFSETAELNSRDSAGFIKTVCRDLSISLPDTDTEGLVVFMEKNWMIYEDKFEAFKSAGKGEFVLVAALPGDLPGGVGHLAILLAEKDQQNHHYVFGGSSNAILRSKGENTLEYIFPKKMQHLLRYYSPKTGGDGNVSWQ